MRKSPQSKGGGTQYSQEQRPTPGRGCEPDQCFCALTIIVPTRQKILYGEKASTQRRKNLSFFIAPIPPLRFASGTFTQLLGMSGEEDNL